MTGTDARFLFEPTFEPADPVTEDAVCDLAADLGLPMSTPSKRDKVIVILSSLLWACGQMRRDGKEDNLIGWSHDDKYWLGFPAVGKAVVKEVRLALIANGMLTQSMRGIFRETMTTYTIDESLFLINGSWLQSRNPQVAVKESKTKSHFTGESYGGKRLSPAQAETRFGAALEAMIEQVDEFNKHWKDHPLCIGGNFYASATRVFSGGRLDKGGRLYGGWVTLPEQARLLGTIDGDAVAEVDIRAANLTILTGTNGLGMLSNPFGDPYAIVDADRSMVKQVALELLGAGNGLKRRGSKDFSVAFGKGTFVPVRDKLVAAYPALKSLEKDVLDSNSLAFIESEIVIETIKRLMGDGITVFPMHDALICKASDADTVAKSLQDVFEAQCSIRPALKVQVAGKADKEILGCYTLSAH